MKALIITPLNDIGIVKLKKYVASCTNPSISDRVRMWKAKKIESLIYKGVAKPKMLREEWDDKTNTYSLIVESEFESFHKELLENGKINFLKVIKDSGDNFSMELIEHE